ncbi:hypothetical protein VPH35_111923 [Triticum aestivum]
MRAGRAGRRGTPSVCRRRRKSSACVAGVVMEHGATGVVAPGRVRGLGHARDDDNGSSNIKSDDGKHATRHSDGRRPQWRGATAVEARGAVCVWHSGLVAR